MKIRIKRWIIGIVWIGIVLNSSGCGKNKTQSSSGSVQKNNYTFMEDGILYCNPRKTVEGSVISAWSSHGIVGKEFTLYI